MSPATLTLMAFDAEYDGKHLIRSIDNGVAVLDLEGSDGDWRRGLITRIVVRAGVTTIGKGAFDSCTSLSSVILPEGLTKIESFAFYHCSSLSSVIFPEGLTEIGQNAFDGCRSLASVILPEAVTKIGMWAFDMCLSLSSINLPEGLTTIRHGRIDFLNNCPILERRRIASGHKDIVSYLQFISLPAIRAVRANRRYAVLASLARLREELYARQEEEEKKKKKKRAEESGGRQAAGRQEGEGDAVEEREEEVGEEEEKEERAGVLRGGLGFDMIHSDDLWRHMLGFV